MSSKQKALLLPEKGSAFTQGTVPVPNPGPGELLVKIESVALNPIDWKLQMFGFYVKEYPAILGLDAAGTVVGLGEGATGFAVGDRVLAQGNFDNLHGTYQEYFLAAADIAAKIPDNVSSDEASTLPLCLTTAAIGLFVQDSPESGAGLFPAWEEGGLGKYAGKPIVIFGGSGSVGRYVLQLAKLAGFSQIITTASLHNTELVKSLGATHVVDRKLSSAELISAVRAITPAPIDVVYDTVGTKDTQNVAYELLAPDGTLVATLDNALDPAKKTADKKFVYVYGSAHSPPSNHKLGASLFGKLTQLLAEGTIKPSPVEVLPGGFSGIPDGLERLKTNQVSGVKLVIHPQETALTSAIAVFPQVSTVCKPLTSEAV